MLKEFFNRNSKAINKINLIFASLFFSLMTLCVKKIDNRIPIYELVFFRSLLSLSITSLIIKKRIVKRMRNECLYLLLLLPIPLLLNVFDEDISQFGRFIRVNELKIWKIGDRTQRCSRHRDDGEGNRQRISVGGRGHHAGSGRGHGDGAPFQHVWREPHGLGRRYGRTRRHRGRGHAAE